MVGQSVLTFRGLMVLTDALQRNRQVKVTQYRASTQDINPLDPNMTTMPSVWKTGNISAYIPVNNNTVEFIIDIPQEEATNYTRSFGLYLEDGTLFMLAKPPYPFPPGLRQVMKIQLVFQNATQIINFQYVPFYETEQDLRVLEATLILSSKMLEVQKDVALLKQRDTALQQQINTLKIESNEQDRRLTEIEKRTDSIEESMLSLLGSYSLFASLYLETLKEINKRR